VAGFDYSALLEKAQVLQRQMEEKQAELARRQVTGSAGGGMVTVTANGQGVLLKVQLEPQAVDPRDVPMLEDLVLAAANAALANARALQQETLAPLAGGLMSGPGR
jgi:DNA-binding YbaB/EbfC family protein